LGGGLIERELDIWGRKVLSNQVARGGTKLLNWLIRSKKWGGGTGERKETGIKTALEGSEEG